MWEMNLGHWVVKQVLLSMCHPCSPIYLSICTWLQLRTMIPLTSVHQSHLCKLSPIGHLGINSYSKEDQFKRKWTCGWPTSNNCDPWQISVEKVLGIFYLPPALEPPNPFCWPAAHLEVLRGQHSFPLWKKKWTQTI